MVGALVGDPALNKGLRIQEVIAYLNEGQYAVGKLLDEVEVWPYETTGNITTANGTAAYSLPRDFQEVVRVTYDVANSGTRYQSSFVPQEQLGVIDTNTFYGGRAANVPTREPLYSLLGSQITVYPTPTAATTNGIVVTYRRTPPELLFERVSENLSTSGAGNAGGTTIVDTSLTERDDFWNECEVVIETGTNINQRRIVEDFDAATDTLTVRHAFAGQVAGTVTFSLYDHSIIPKQHHFLVVLHAAALAATRMGLPVAASLIAQRDGEFAAIRRKWQEPIKPVLSETDPQQRVNLS